MSQDSAFTRCIVGVFFVLVAYLAYQHVGELWASSGWLFRLALLFFPVLLVFVFLEMLVRSVKVDGDRIRYRSLLGARTDFDISEVSEANMALGGRLKLRTRSGKWLVFYSNETATREIARKLNIKSGKSEYHF